MIKDKTCSKSLARSPRRYISNFKDDFEWACPIELFKLHLQRSKQRIISDRQEEKDSLPAMRRTKHPLGEIILQIWSENATAKRPVQSDQKGPRVKGGENLSLRGVCADRAPFKVDKRGKLCV